MILFQYHLYLTLGDKLKPDISINRKEYCISPAGILEFDEMEMIEATIQILKDLPKESIIDIVLYERTME